jgi:hypothetical protein
MLNRSARPVADDKVGFYVAFFKGLKQSHAEDGAGCAG